VEVLIGHGDCNIIYEGSVNIPKDEVCDVVYRIITGHGSMLNVNYKQVPQDSHLAENQLGAVRCGDNGIFIGHYASDIELELAEFAHRIYGKYPFDGKYVISDDGSHKKIIICQSHMPEDGYEEIRTFLKKYNHITDVVINPLGTWTGGTDVDSGATNRKLGSDMGEGVTGGGLHGKDCTKADVSMNIECWRKSVSSHSIVTACCGIGDDEVTFVYDNGNRETVKYSEVVESAKNWIFKIGGFEEFAEWGLIR
jgi:S-adenosylmethionine synthetase